MPPLVKIMLWKKLVNRSGNAPRSNLKSWGFSFLGLVWSPCKDLCEDRIPHVMAHHMSFLYSQLGPQGQRLFSRMNQVSSGSTSPVQPVLSESRRNPLAYPRNQTQDGQTSPPDSFCSNNLHWGIYFTFYTILMNYLWHGGSHNWMWGTHGSKLLFQDPNPRKTLLSTVDFNLTIVDMSL